MLFKRYSLDHQLKEKNKTKKESPWIWKETNNIHFFTLILMWIPSSWIWSGRKIQSLLCKSKHRLLMPNRMRRWYSGHLFVWSCDLAVRVLDIENQANVDYYCWMPGARWLHFARPWTHESKPALTDYSIAEKRRAEALHVVFFKQASVGVYTGGICTAHIISGIWARYLLS